MYVILGKSTNMPKMTIIKTSTITKQTTLQLSPSVIGIQRLREAFLEAKNKNIFVLRIYLLI